MVFPAFIEIMEHYEVTKNIKDKKFVFNLFFTKLLPLALIPCGTLVYLGINYNLTGDFFYFMKLQAKYWHEEYVSFFKIINTFITNISNGDMYNILTQQLPQLLIVIFMYVVLIKGVSKHKPMYSIFLLTYIILNTSLTIPLSLGRYFTCAVPAFIFLADWCEKKQSRYIPFIVGFSMLFGLIFVEYLTWKHIM